MYQTDFETFAQTLRKLTEVFSKTLSDGTVQAYWEALKDLPLSTVTRLADQHTRYGKFFPKPVELRPKEDKPKVTDPAGEAKFRAAEAFTVTNLEEIRGKNPEAWRNDVWMRKLDRILATTPESSPIHAQALDEARRLSPLVRGY